MAQLRDTVVAGSLRATDTLFSTTAQFNILKIPTTSGSTTYSAGTSGQILKTNGSSVYWANDLRGVTNVQVQATSPVVSSTNTAQTSSLNTTISLANAYGDTKNPYGTKTPNYVLAGPSSGTTAAAPSFRALVAADIPTISITDKTSGTLTVPRGGTGATDAAGARANLGITPANIGAVAKSGDTMTGTLTMVNSNNPDGSDITCYIDNKSILFYKDSSSTSSWAPIIQLQNRDSANPGEVHISSNGGIEIYGPVSGASSYKVAYLNGDGLYTRGTLSVDDIATIRDNIIQTTGYISRENNSANHALKLGLNYDNVMKFFEYGGQFDFYQSQSGTNTLLFQVKNGVSSAPLPVNNGGTGATTATGALANLGAIGTYSRTDIGTSPNFDNPGINGLFEVRDASEIPGATGTRPPFGGYGPMISIKSPDNIAMMQIAIASDGSLYYRGKQKGAVTMADTSWKSVLNKSGDTMTGPLTVPMIASVGESGKDAVINAYAAAGQIWLYSQPSATGTRGIYTSNSSGSSKPILYVDANNNVVLGFTVDVPHGGTGATTYAQARKNLQIGEKITSARVTINSQASNTWSVFTTNGSTAWQSPTLETGLYLFSIRLREQGDGGKVDLMINSSGTGDPIMSEEIANWGIINRTFVVEMTSSWVYLWHKHQGSTHTVDARVNIYRLN